MILLTEKASKNYNFLAFWQIFLYLYLDMYQESNLEKSLHLLDQALGSSNYSPATGVIK